MFIKKGKSKKFRPERYGQILPIVKKCENPDNLPFKLFFETPAQARTCRQYIYRYYKEEYAEVEDMLTDAEKYEWNLKVPSIRVLEDGKSLIILNNIHRNQGSKYTVMLRDKELEVFKGQVKKVKRD